MKISVIATILLVVFLGTPQLLFAAEDKEKRMAEIDAYWAEVSRTVNEGDFAGYKATCHPEAVLVSGSKKVSYPLTVALARWEKDFTATKSGKVKARVEFRFSERFNDATTAHETGIFCYTSVTADGKKTQDYINLVALLVKRDGKWLILMEHQKSRATKEEWDALAKPQP